MIAEPHHGLFSNIRKPEQAHYPQDSSNSKANTALLGIKLKVHLLAQVNRELIIRWVR